MVEMGDLYKIYIRFGGDFLEILESFDEGELFETEIKEKIKDSYFHKEFIKYLKKEKGYEIISDDGFSIEVMDTIGEGQGGIPIIEYDSRRKRHHPPSWTRIMGAIGRIDKPIQ